MKLSFSKRFIKQAKTLDSVTKKLLHTVLEEAEGANSVEEIGNCMKMSGYKQVYRIRISDHRAIFILRTASSLFFQYIVSRGEVYGKKYRELLKGE